MMTVFAATAGVWPGSSGVVGKLCLYPTTHHTVWRHHAHIVNPSHTAATSSIPGAPALSSPPQSPHRRPHHTLRAKTWRLTTLLNIRGACVVCGGNVNARREYTHTRGTHGHAWGDTQSAEGRDPPPQAQGPRGYIGIGIV